MLFKSIPAQMMNPAIMRKPKLRYKSFQHLYLKDMINVFVIEMHTFFDAKTHFERNILKKISLKSLMKQLSLLQI
jgi:hypothetical protein